MSAGVSVSPVRPSADNSQKPGIPPHLVASNGEDEEANVASLKVAESGNLAMPPRRGYPHQEAVLRPSLCPGVGQMRNSD